MAAQKRKRFWTGHLNTNFNNPHFCFHKPETLARIGAARGRFLAAARRQLPPPQPPPGLLLTADF
jgi:hypothetical protein